MLAILDMYLYEDLSDTVASYLPLHEIGGHRERIYTSYTAAFDLPVPRFVYKETVWLERLINPDTCNAARLLACDVLGLNDELYMVDIFKGVSLNMHVQCNSGIVRLIRFKSPTPPECKFIQNHMLLDWLPLFSILVEECDHTRFSRCGYGPLIARILTRLVENVHINDVTTIAVLEYITYEMQNPEFVDRVYKYSRPEFIRMYRNMDLYFTTEKSTIDNIHHMIRKLRTQDYYIPE